MEETGKNENAPSSEDNTPVVDREDGALSAQVKNLAQSVEDITEKVDKVLSSFSGVKTIGKVVKDAQDAAEGKTEAEQQRVLDNAEKDFKAALAAKDSEILALKQKELESNRKSTKSGFGSFSVKELDAFQDSLVLMSSILKKPINQLKMYRENENKVKSLQQRVFTKANVQSTDAGYGGEWIPTGLSSTLLEDIEAANVLASWVPNFNMPTNPYKFPIKLQTPSAWLLSENKTDSPSAIPTSQFTTDDLTFDAEKIGTLLMSSTDVTEDSLLAVLPIMRQQLVKGMVEGFDNAIVNGDDSSTHMDSGVVSPSPAKAWKGFRKIGLAGSFTYDFDGTISADDMQMLRASMAVGGKNVSDLAYIMSSTAYLREMVLLRDKNNNNVVLTLETYGPNATVFKGEIARLFGVPIIVSDQLPALVNASGVIDATGGNNLYYPILCVNRTGWMLGNVRGVTIKSKEEITYDQIVTVATARADLQNVFPTVAPVAVGLKASPTP